MYIKNSINTGIRLTNLLKTISSSTVIATQNELWSCQAIKYKNHGLNKKGLIIKLEHN